MSDYYTRFGGIGRLYGAAGLEKLRSLHACVVGVGGVGSWSVEALARTGIGQLTLIDLDDVCLSNVNRQLPALDGEVGKLKIDVLAARTRLINPECQVNAEATFFTDSTVDRLLGQGFDVVIDAIDAVSNKCRLIAECRQRRIPIVTVGGAGGRKNPSAVKVDDLSRAIGDPLLAKVRRQLRRDFEFPRERRWKFKVPCVYSDEPVVFPWGDGTVCATKEKGAALRLNCDQGFGTASFVTGTMGFTAAAVAVDVALAVPSQ
ncbi:tRNA threonylcarbamoyladenosine dehydratase [Cerasicoccus arenae]|uniref:tRNA threonylcarbamoyladenosine dehydratase n=1 Tax=Cerasicoccus arenae TaxID=424488 RepID=A0A8J3GCH0_9BACT|nr:tRNA threonylcarbamoyladenosine dehydratase [Cerasicoccus arenae]MBK1858708.1 tRNA threonylcarbamoyladenosine dehydratase [Cerasicoccus arenae]GHB98430.1 tRNA threonylcarbamoyladenosine dehydratase [Cerasicoccus arenae]